MEAIVIFRKIYIVLSPKFPNIFMPIKLHDNRLQTRKKCPYF